MTKFFQRKNKNNIVHVAMIPTQNLKKQDIIGIIENKCIGFVLVKNSKTLIDLLKSCVEYFVPSRNIRNNWN